MHRLTKLQIRDNEIIQAWLANQPYRRNSRDKNPQVPELTVEQVVEMYSPPDITGAAQFFTPLEMVQVIHDELVYYNAPDLAILDPCCGIGNLLYPLADGFAGRVVGYDLERETVEIARKLYPYPNWTFQNEIPFDHLADIEGKFDLVLCNPPFGTRRGMYPGEEMSAGRSSASEQIFFELCIRALCPGGTAAIIAPYNFHDKLTKPLRKWLEGKAELLGLSDDYLPGKFKHTGVSVKLFIYRRSMETEPEPEPVVVKPSVQIEQLALAW